MEKDFNDFQNMYNSNNNFNGVDMNDPMFNPMLQYEQAYAYYRYLCMQMDYKIKCKEYEKLCKENAKCSNSTNVNTSSSNISSKTT